MYIYMSHVEIDDEKAMLVSSIVDIWIIFEYNNIILAYIIFYKGTLT